MIILAPLQEICNLNHTKTVISSFTLRSPVKRIAMAAISDQCFFFINSIPILASLQNVMLHDSSQILT